MAETYTREQLNHMDASEHTEVTLSLQKQLADMERKIHDEHTAV